MAFAVINVQSGAQHCSVPVQLSPDLPGPVVCASDLFPPCPLEIAWFAAWDGAVPLWAGAALAEPSGFRGEVLAGHWEPQASLHHLGFTPASWRGGAPHNPVWVPLLGWQAGQDTWKWRGIAHPGSVWLCVTEHPCTQVRSSTGTHSSTAGGAEQQHSEHCESRVGSTGEESLKKNSHGFLAFIHTFMAWFLWGFAGIFFFFFSLAWFLHYRLNPEVFSCLSFPVPTYVFPKFPWSAACPRSFVTPFVTTLQACSSDKSGRSNHHREAILCSESKAPCNRLLETGNLPWQNAALPLVSQNECSFPEMRGDKPGKCYTWNGKAV